MDVLLPPKKVPVRVRVYLVDATKLMKGDAAIRCFRLELVTFIRDE